MVNSFFAKVAAKIESVNSFFYYLSALAILMSALILTYEVFMRYFFHTPTIWEIEASVYLIILATFGGAAYGLKEGAHIKIDLLTRLLSTKWNQRLTILTSFLALGFCVLVAWRSWAMWWEAFSKGWRSESLWGVPLAIPYFFIPMGMSLLSLQYFIEIKKSWNFTQKDSYPHGSGKRYKENKV